MAAPRTIELPIRGMDCDECTRHVQQALTAVPGVTAVTVLLAAEKALVTLDPAQVDLPVLQHAVVSVGYQVDETASVTRGAAPQRARVGADFTRQVLTLFGLVFGAVLLIVVAGEWLGLFDVITERVPWPIGFVLVLLAGYPVFRGVFQAAWQHQVTSHTLMTVGVLAALLVGEWATAAVIVFFMRVGDYAERFTTERARRAVKDLTALAPQRARVERDGIELEMPVTEVQPGMTVVVRPGEQIPVDGLVVVGHATINQATITGESLPVEVGPGSRVFAATIAQLGALRVQATQIGADTTFGKVITMVEEAEAHRADVQRIADRFSAWYLPVVTLVATLTFLIRQDPLATAAVLVVACSCSFALATPIAMLASIGAAAKRGLIIKGGKYLEVLARADVLLVDKTGTLTLGQPHITDVLALNGIPADQLLGLAAAAEQDSEHPLAAAVRQAAHERQVPILMSSQFVALPGQGVRASVDGQDVRVGSHRLVTEAANEPRVQELLAAGKTLLYVSRNDELVGILAAADTVRPEVWQALAEVRALGINRIELLTGDNERTAATLATQVGIGYQANLLPEDKIRIVKGYQAQGHRVVMVGDGVNDAPALAQATIGIAMGVAGSDIAIEAAHIALMRDDWRLVPEVVRIARRTMGVVRFNIGFTAVYNLLGLSLAAFGLLPPLLAAAAQSVPDIGILVNSTRLLHTKQ